MSNRTGHFPAELGEDEISGLMTMVKARSVNPVDYDRKINFWRGAIENSCASSKDAVISVDVIKKRFRRGDVVPACINAVIENMISTGDIISVDEWKEKHSSWLQWGVTRLWKTSGWLLGASDDSNNDYINLPALQKQAQEIVQLYEQEFKDELDSTGEVVAWAELYDRAGSIVETEENFEFALQLLADRGDILVGNARNGEKVIKFKDTREKGPFRFTETDASVHDIKIALNKLQKEIHTLEAKVKKLELDSRAAVRASDKHKAYKLLQQKQRVTKDLGAKDVQYQKLLAMLNQIGSARHNNEVLAAFKMGTDAFKANLARHGLSPEKIDATMDEVHEAADEFREIEEAIGQGFAQADATNSEELERELEELMKTQEKPKAPARKADPTLDLPAVPSGSLKRPATSDMTLEDRLKKLREMA
ncbi:unnamed protein product, partial [Mesorhabditis spiculigera]